MSQWLDLSKLLSRGMSVNVGSLPIMRKKFKLNLCLGMGIVKILSILPLL